MSLQVPGIGDVPIIWMPASDPDFGVGRAGRQPIAIVHHRIVGDLNSADNTFAANDTDPKTVGSPTRAVAANFGIGVDTDGKLYVHQFVDLSDTAYCNGDFQAGSNWEDWGYPLGYVTVDNVQMRPCNPMTVSIEHDDNGGLPAGDPRKGVVDEETIKASIALDRLMLSGDLAAMRAAGIHIRDEATATALGKIVPGPRTLIDHHDIAGTNKPTCWRPWASDTVGFPRTRYVSELTQTGECTQADLDALNAAWQAKYDALTAASKQQIKSLEDQLALREAQDNEISNQLHDIASKLAS